MGVSAGPQPRPLNWPEVHKKASDEYLYTFDFGKGALNFRRGLTPGREHFEFAITSKDKPVGHEFSGDRRALSVIWQRRAF